MKILTAPFLLFKFWYPESLIVWARVWKNSLQVIEEDLAVGLMLRLLFTPLFHDSSLVGRGLSFIFRLLRVLLGILAFFLVTIFYMALTMAWILTPMLAIYLGGLWGVIFKVVLFSGGVLFVNHLLSHPPKKIWQIKSLDEIFLASVIKENDINLNRLLTNLEVKEFLLYLELDSKELIDHLRVPQRQELLKDVFDLAKEEMVSYITPVYFMAAILTNSINETALMKLDTGSELVRATLKFLNLKQKNWRRVYIWDEDFQIKHLRGVNRGWLGTITPNLDLYSDDLTKKATSQNLTDFIGRANIINQVINVLSLHQGRNVILVGEAGSGKTTLVHYLAKLIVTGDAPASLSTKRLVELDLNRLLSGIKTQGDLAQRLKEVFEDITYSENIILFIEEFHQLGAGEVGSEFNLYSLLLPYLESDKFQLLTTTEEAGYRQLIQKNSSLARLFTKVEISQTDFKESFEILSFQAIYTERYQKVKTTIPALSAMIKLAQDFISDRSLPDSAVGLFQRSITTSKGGWVDKKQVEELIEQEVKVPVGNLDSDKKVNLLNLETTIHNSLVDQEDAVKKVAESLRRSAARLNDSNRPIGTFLFVGPTGVGKTELAKTLAKEYFNGGGQFIRLDMSEYQDEGSINRLISDDGTLIKSIRNNPYSLVLLDEFEKADPKVLNVFLQLLDDGRLTSISGETLNFKNTIVIATSNIGSLLIASALQEIPQLTPEIDQQIKEELLKVLKPELLNRFDEVVIFKPLSPSDLDQVIKLKLKKLVAKLKDQGYVVEFSDQVVSKLAKEGYDPKFGARSLERAIQDTVESDLSKMILEGKLTKGEKVVI